MSQENGISTLANPVSSLFSAVTAFFAMLSAYQPYAAYLRLLLITKPAPVSPVRMIPKRYIMLVPKPPVEGRATPGMFLTMMVSLFAVASSLVSSIVIIAVSSEMFTLN